MNTTYMNNYNELNSSISTIYYLYNCMLSQYLLKVCLCFKIRVSKMQSFVFTNCKVHSINTTFIVFPFIICPLYYKFVTRKLYSILFHKQDFTNIYLPECNTSSCNSTSQVHIFSFDGVEPH